MSNEAKTTTAVQANDLLRIMGWQLTEVTVYQTTGFAMVKAERRDHEAGRGLLVTLHRSRHGAPVTETRETTTRRPGMFQSFWEVDEGGLIGRRRFPGFRSGLRCLAGYIDDNRIEGAPSLARSAIRAIAGATGPIPTPRGHRDMTSKAKTPAWDPSIIGHSHDEVAAMTDEERQQAMVDAINRAADILRHAADAFGDTLRPSETRYCRRFADHLIDIARDADPDA